MDSSFEVVRVAERNRYELRRGERMIGFVDTVPQGDVVVIPYVQVDREFEGRGLGSQLVTGALRDLFAQGKQVVAQCPFAAVVLRRHQRSSQNRATE